jgi:hypothetical protein
MKYLLATCILLFILYICSGRYVCFMSRQETRLFLLRDADGYVESLSDHDLKAMHFLDHYDMLSRASASSDSFTLAEKIKLLSAIAKADLFFYRLRLDPLLYPGINPLFIAKLPWHLALTRGTIYEEGLPHTRHGVIFLSDRVLNQPWNLLVRTLVHEKVHIYEHAHSAHIYRWIAERGYIRKARLREITRGRSNPDLDGWVYEDPKGKLTVALFKSDSPTGLDDVNYPHGHPWSEHPFETLAYEIDAML